MHNIKKFFILSVLTFITFAALYAKEADRSYIYIAKDALIYGKEHLVVRANPHRSQNSQNKKTIANKDLLDKETDAKQNKKGEEPAAVVTVLPYALSSSLDLYMSEKQGETSLRYRFNKLQTLCRAYNKNACQFIESIYFTIYLPVQRQKLSATAIQYGMLTSFSAQSPPEGFMV